MLVVDRAVPVSAPVESLFAEEDIGVIALRDNMRHIGGAVKCVRRAFLRKDMHGPVFVEGKERIFQRIQVDCKTEGVPGELVGVCCLPEAEAGRIVIRHGGLVGAYAVTRPVVIDQMHFPDLVASHKELTENEKHIICDFRVDNHLPDLDLPVKIVMHHT